MDELALRIKENICREIIRAIDSKIDDMVNIEAYDGEPTLSIEQKEYIRGLVDIRDYIFKKYMSN
jgi:hypothetical protein